MESAEVSGDPVSPLEILAEEQRHQYADRSVDQALGRFCLLPPILEASKYRPVGG